VWIDSTLTTSISPLRTKAPATRSRSRSDCHLRAGTDCSRSLSAEAELQAFTTHPVSVMPSKMANPLMKSARSVFVPVVYVSSRDVGLGCGGTPGLTPDYHDPLSTLASCT
jgi:hypothetical protein